MAPKGTNKKDVLNPRTPGMATESDDPTEQDLLSAIDQMNDLEFLERRRQEINEWFGDGETISRATMAEIAEDLKTVYRSQLSAMNNDETGEQYDPEPENQ